MTVKQKQILLVILTTTIFFTISINGHSQGFLDKILNKADKTLNTIDKALDSKKKIDNSKNGGTPKKGNAERRPKLSELKESDFIQNDQNPERDTSNTRYRIAKNLLIDIEGKYPNGYKPSWRFINYNSPLNFTTENWLFPKANTSQERKNISIGDYGGKAVLRIDAFTLCHCFADIIVKDSFNVLTEKPQTFEIANFRKILNDRSTGEPCMPSNNWHYAGGWAGKITLFANKNGDITMDLMLENYSAEHGDKPSQVSIRYIAKGITVENEMSAEKANGIIAAELEAKQKYADYIKKSEKQISELMSAIKTKYPGFNCISCFSRTSSYGVQPTTTLTEWSNGTVTEDNDFSVTNTMKIENKCNQELTFIGIQQLYDDEKGYYYKDVTRTMEAKYYYQAKQGLFMSIFTSVAGLDGDIVVQPAYSISSARIGGIQWIKVTGKKKP